MSADPKDVMEHIHYKAQRELNRIDPKVRPILEGESISGIIGIAVYCLGLAHEYSPVGVRGAVHDVFDAAKQIWHATLLTPEDEYERSSNEQTEVRERVRDPGTPPPRPKR